jgi:cytochrome c553
MKPALYVAFAALVLAQSAAADLTQADADRGAKLVAVCAACHGEDGNSAAADFPKLAGLGDKYLYKQLRDIRDGARPVALMAGQVDNMDDQQLADIAAFYAAQDITGAQADPEKVELGERIYRGGIAARGVAACQACHSPRGLGNEPAGFPRLSGQHAAYIAAQLKAYRLGYEDPAGRTNDGETMIMRSIAFGLSDREIEAVSNYAAGLY